MQVLQLVRCPAPFPIGSVSPRTQLRLSASPQAKTLRGSLDTMKLGNALWVVSPLTRALETFQLACPKTPVLKAEAAGEPTHGELPRVQVLPDMTEHLMTAGDIGRPASELIEDFPFVSARLL